MEIENKCETDNELIHLIASNQNIHVRIKSSYLTRGYSLYF